MSLRTVTATNFLAGLSDKQIEDAVTGLVQQSA